MPIQPWNQNSSTQYPTQSPQDFLGNVNNDASSIFKGGNPTPPPKISFPQALGQGISNLGSSIGSNIRAIGSAIVHPIKTVEGLGKLALGAISPQNAGGDINPQTGESIPVPPISSAAQSFQNFSDNFAGGLMGGKGFEGFKEKLAKDPAGLLIDLSIIGDGINGLVNQVHDLAVAPELTGGESALPKFAETTKVINPVQSPFEIVGSALEKLGKPKSNIAIENVKAAQELGIEKPPVIITSPNSIVKMAVNYISGGFFGGKMRAALDSAKNILSGKANEAINLLPRGLDDASVGEKIIAAKNSFETTTKSIVKPIYDAVDSKFGDLSTPVPNTLKEIDAQIGQFSQAAGRTYNSVISGLKSIRDDLQYGKSTVSGFKQSSLGFNLEDVGGAMPSYNPTYSILKATRTALGNLFKKEGISQLSLTKVYDAMSVDRDAALRAVAPDIADTLKTTDNTYAKLKETLDTKVSKMIDGATTEEVVQKLIKGNNSTTLNELKDSGMIDPETFTHIGLSWIKNVVDNATDGVTGQLNIGKFVSDINKLDEPTKNALFDTGQIDNLNKVTDTLTKVKNIQDVISKSSEASNMLRKSMLIRGMGLPFLVAMGNPTSFFTYLMGMQGGEFLGSKLFGTELGKSLLTTGSAGLQSIGKGIKVTGDVAGKAAKVSNVLQETKSQGK